MQQSLYMFLFLGSASKAKENRTRQPARQFKCEPAYEIIKHLEGPPSHEY